jgi:hypothetical protein
VSNNYSEIQHSVCARVGGVYVSAPETLMVGISIDLLTHNWQYPINGLRHNPQGDTSGWYIWSGKGELSQDADYFKPLHIQHLREYCPDVMPYLGLAPGWRFLLAPNYEDLWFDEKLIQVT